MLLPLPLSPVESEPPATEAPLMERSPIDGQHIREVVEYLRTEQKAADDRVERWLDKASEWGEKLRDG